MRTPVASFIVLQSCKIAAYRHYDVAQYNRKSLKLHQVLMTYIYYLKFLHKLEHTCLTLLAQAAGVRSCIQQITSDIYYLRYIILLGCFMFFASMRRTSEAYLNSGIALK